MCLGAGHAEPGGHWDERPRAAVELAADDPGGMLAFPLAKQSFYTATAQLWLGGRDSYADAERNAIHAVELYEADPLEQRRLGELCLARLDLAAARLGRDDLDGAAEQLLDVMAITAQRRTDSVSRRLNQVGRTLPGAGG